MGILAVLKEIGAGEQRITLDGCRKDGRDVPKGGENKDSGASSREHGDQLIIDKTFNAIVVSE